MASFQNVSKSELCPICGKPDWCSVQHVENGITLHYCRRVLSGQDITSGVNGLHYIFIKQTRDGSCMYKEESAYLFSKEEWLKRKGICTSGNRHRQQRPKGSVPPHVSVPEPEPGVIPLPNEQLDAIYRAFLRKLHLHKSHVRYLSRERWSNDLILQSMTRSMPPADNQYYYGTGRIQITKELLHEFGSLEGVPGFYERNGVWTFAGSSGILLPLYDHNRNLYRLRLRLDHPDVDENGKEKNKYHNFSSYYETRAGGQTVNAFSHGCRSGSHIGLYVNPTRDDFTICYITEGEKKSIFSNYVLHCPIVSIPGVNAFGKVLETSDDGRNVLNYLHAKGCTTVIIAYDSDKYVNEAVLMYERKLIELLIGQNLHFKVALAYWNPGFGKGLDDILSINVRPNYELVRV